MKPTACLLAIFVLTATFGATETQPHAGHDATVEHSFKNAEEWAARFDSPDREEWQKPGSLLRLLAIEDGQRVADLGCGTGYFTWMISALVGVTGKVYAVDIEQEMLDHLMSREDLPAYENIVPVLAEPDDPKLPAGELDLILTVNTWHHINGRLKYLEHVARALRPLGRLAIVDWREGELPMGPPAGHKLSREAVIRELGEAGWQLTTEGVALPYQYILIFRRP